MLALKFCSRCWRRPGSWKRSFSQAPSYVKSSGPQSSAARGRSLNSIGDTWSYTAGRGCNRGAIAYLDLELRSLGSRSTFENMENGEEAQGPSSAEQLTFIHSFIHFEQHLNALPPLHLATSQRSTFRNACPWLAGPLSRAFLQLFVVLYYSTFQSTR